MTTIAQAYTNWAATYDADPNRTRDLDADVTRQAFSSRRLGRVLEIGCGTGKNTALLAEIAAEVRALDFSEGMLAQARAKITAPHVTFARADLTQPWGVADQWGHLVLCNLVLEHIADLGFIFRQAARVLVPGGEFFVCELHPFRQYQGTQANFQRAGGAVNIPAFVHHLSDYVQAGRAAGLALDDCCEHWHADDAGAPPRLLSLLFRKAGGE